MNKIEQFLTQKKMRCLFSNLLEIIAEVGREKRPKHCTYTQKWLLLMDCLRSPFPRKDRNGTINIKEIMLASSVLVRPHEHPDL